MCLTIMKSVTVRRGNNIRCYTPEGRNMGIKGYKKNDPKRNVFQSARQIGKEGVTRKLAGVKFGGNPIMWYVEKISNKNIFTRHEYNNYNVDLILPLFSQGASRTFITLCIRES